MITFLLTALNDIDPGPWKLVALAEALLVDVPFILYFHFREKP